MTDARANDQMRPVHVAGVIDFEEAELLIDCGIKYLGFPLVLDHHEEDLTIEAAAAIVSKLKARANFFLITYLSTAPDIIELCRTLSVDLVQLHGETDPEQVERVKRTAPNVRIIKSLIVRGDEAGPLIDEARRFEATVDAFITDTFDPATGASGATGKVHDWEVSRQLVRATARPVILAGGLTPQNVACAIRFVRPAGVDVHTGIEDQDGRKARDLTKRFVAEASAGFADLDIR